MFEIKNIVFDIKHPSNIDIVLISYESKKILFLESKFSEYLVGSKARNISDMYLDLYKKLGLFDDEGSLMDKWEINTRTSDNGKYIIDDIAEAIDDKLKDKKIILFIGRLSLEKSHSILIKAVSKNPIK